MIYFRNIPTCTFHWAYEPKDVAAVDRTELRILLSAISIRPRCRVLEIGTAKGETTAEMAKVVKALRGHITTVDIMRMPDNIPAVQKAECDIALRSVGECIPVELRPIVTQVLVDPNVKDSLRTELFRACGADLVWDVVFIDGDHSYAGVRSDWDVCRTMLTPDSVMLFHDVWWDVTPPPVDGPLKLLDSLQGIVLNLTHLGVLPEHYDNVREV